jgi:hypothetical protein
MGAWLIVMSAGYELLAVSTKVITDLGLKFVQPLPVIFTGMVAPAFAAPGNTEVTAAPGFVAVPEPVSAAENDQLPAAVDPLEAEFGIASVPVIAAVALGSKVT